jgi:hypothetical protein
MIVVLSTVQPRGQGRFPAGGLTDDLQPERVEGAGGDLVTVEP